MLLCSKVGIPPTAVGGLFNSKLPFELIPTRLNPTHGRSREKIEMIAYTTQGQKFAGREGGPCPRLNLKPIQRKSRDRVRLPYLRISVC